MKSMPSEKFIPVAKPSLLGKELEYLTNCIEENWISSQGRFVKEFEQKFAGYCNCKYGVAVSNGTVALHLALAALGIKKGDEVIIPDLTFAATVNAVLYTGARPVIVDVDLESWNINPEFIRRVINERTKAIIPVHLYGFPCKMDAIRDIAVEYGLFVIEDCAEAHGARYKNKVVGGFSDISCFSFFANKIVTTGEGGMCLTNEEAVYERLKILRDHGKNPGNQYWHDVVGFNYRMTNLQAAVGLAQLENLPHFLEERQNIADKYKSLLNKNPYISLRSDTSQCQQVPWLFTILVPEKDRDSLIKFLSERHIESRPVFCPIHTMPPYKEFLSSDFFYPNSLHLSKKGLSLPTFVGLEAGEIEMISEEVNKYFGL